MCVHVTWLQGCADLMRKLSLQLHNDTNVTYVSGTSLRSNPIYVTYYIFWSKFIFVEVIPYFTILILNSLIIGKIWKSSKFRKRFVVSDQQHPDQAVVHH